MGNNETFLGNNISVSESINESVNETLNQTLNETAAEAINENRSSGREEVESLGWTGLMPAWAEGLAELLCQPFS